MKEQISIKMFIKTNIVPLKYGFYVVLELSSKSCAFSYDFEP